MTELRIATTTNESENQESQPVIAGYAALFNSPSEDLGGFTEIIKPGAFASAITRGDDVRALWNHDPNFVLGRTKSGTLTLSEDDKGLAISINPPDTQWANDLITSIQRGDVDQMSFGFICLQEDWSGDLGSPVREVCDVALFDVSPVTYPAYQQTSVNVRSSQEILATFKPVPPVQPASNDGVDIAIREKELNLKTLEVL